MGDWWLGNAVESSGTQLRNIADDFEEKRTGAETQLASLSEFAAQYRGDHKGPDITTIANLADTVLAGLGTTVATYTTIEDAFNAAADTINDLNERERALRTTIASIDGDVIDMYSGSAYSYGGAGDSTAADRQKAVAAQAEYNAIRAAEDAALKTLAGAIGEASTGDTIEVNDAAVHDILWRLVLDVNDPELVEDLTIAQAVLLDNADGEIDGTKANFETLIGNGATAEGAARVTNGDYSSSWTEKIYEDGLLPRAVDVALEHDISYGEAEFAVLGTEIESLQYEIDNYDGDEPVSKTKLWAERNRRIDILTKGDRGLAREFTAQINDGVSVDEAVEAAVIERYGDATFSETLEATGLAYGNEYNASVFTFALHEQLYEKTEEALDTDFDDDEGPAFEDVDFGLLAMAEESDVSYNTMVAYINGADPADLPEIYRDKPPDYLDLPVTDGDEAAAMLAVEDYNDEDEHFDGDVFTEIETAKQGDERDRDGKMSQADIDAILADPKASAPARAIAQFLDDNPEELNNLDVAKDGRFLSGLGEGEYITAGDGDGVVSRQDVKQYQINRSIFNTLNQGREDGLIGPADRPDGTYSEQALADARANLADPGENGPSTDEQRLAAAIDGTLDNHWLDNRSGWNKFGDGVASHGGVLGLGWELAGYHDDNPTESRRLTTNPVGYAVDFGKGVGDFAVGIYDLSAAIPGSPAFNIELARHQASNQFGDGDHDHRGLAIWQGFGEMGNTAQTFMPWTDDYDKAEEDRRRSGTSKTSDAYNMATSMVDFETFAYQPGRFAGQVAPEIALAAFTFGSSATASVARVTLQQGVRAGARHGLKLVGNNARTWITAPSKVFNATSNNLGTILERSRLKFGSGSRKTITPDGLGDGPITPNPRNPTEELPGTTNPAEQQRRADELATSAQQSDNPALRDLAEQADQMTADQFITEYNQTIRNIENDLDSTVVTGLNDRSPSVETSDTSPQLTPETPRDGRRSGATGDDGAGELRGPFSGREYDPRLTGGPIEELDYHDYVVTPDGVAEVKIHLGRFDDTRANEIMIDRLDQIAAGKIQPTDADLRFYSHELRELERFRNLGVPDGVEGSYEIWNSTHTATLEDFRIREKTAEYKPTLYHEDAWEALGLEPPGSQSGARGSAASPQSQHLPVAQQAYEVYEPYVAPRKQELQSQFDDVATVQTRAKRPESAANRLDRAVENGWVDSIDTPDAAIDNIWDAIGTRLVLKDGPANKDIVVDRLVQQIEAGEIEVTKINSLTGPNGSPYLTRADLDRLEDAGASAGREFTTNLDDSYQTGYSTTTVFIRHSNGLREELQIMGPKVLELANAEHLPYDATLGKPYDYNAHAVQDRAEVEALVKPIEQAVQDLNMAQADEFFEYLNQNYINRRRVELGKPPLDVQPPEGLPTILHVESLLEAQRRLEGLKK